METNPLGSIFSVWLTPLGEIIKSEIKKVSQARFSLEEVPLKTYEEFNASLLTSALVSLDDGNVFPACANIFFPFGNIKDKPLKEILEGEKARFFFSLALRR